MKLAELPKSLYHSARLLLTSGKKLQKRNDQLPVIVSLTTIPSRLSTLPLTIKSLLLQNRQPKKIVLWLHQDYEGRIPGALERLQGEVFEIRFSEYTFSHRKLIHSLAAFPNEIIITCDDDLIYPADYIPKLYQAHLNTPEVVIGHHGRSMRPDGRGGWLPYKRWPFVNSLPDNPKLFMPVGAFCILYPPHALDQRVQDVSLFLQLAPKSDDLWFKTMALLHGTLSIPSQANCTDPIPIAGTQSIALKKTNIKEDLNRKQWERLIDHFQLKSVLDLS
ncbi:glycosyltransferase [Croceiramulus getboli]|nr:glycosyltransferase [Flavobacteriaceae bacterium YJPT1-3]